MKTTRTILFLVLSMFLISTISAVTTYAEFSDDSQSKTIKYGDSIGFDISAFTMNTPMNVKVQLVDSSNNIMHTFFDGSVATKSYSLTETIIPSMYTKTGNFNLIATATDKLNTQTATLTLTVNPETTAPIITLLGANPQIIVRGTAYIELGATANDNIDGDLTSSIVIDSSNINTGVIGSYVINYSVTDAAGNKGNAIRIVNVIPPAADTTAPIITVIVPQIKKYSSNDLTLKISTDEPATVEFKIDDGKKKLMTLSGTNTYVHDVTLSGGSHIVTFYASDSLGNQRITTVSFSIKKDSEDSIRLIEAGEPKTTSSSGSFLTNLNEKSNEAIIIVSEAKVISPFNIEEENALQSFWEMIINFFKRLFGLN